MAEEDNSSLSAAVGLEKGGPLECLSAAGMNEMHLLSGLVPRSADGQHNTSQASSSCSLPRRR